MAEAGLEQEWPLESPLSGPQPRPAASLGGLPPILSAAQEKPAPRLPAQGQQEPRAVPVHPQSVSEGWGPTAALGASEDLGPPGSACSPETRLGRCLPAAISMTGACSGRPPCGSADPC